MVSEFTLGAVPIVDREGGRMGDRGGGRNRMEILASVAYLSLVVVSLFPGAGGLPKGPRSAWLDYPSLFYICIWCFFSIYLIKYFSMACTFLPIFQNVFIES